MEYFLSYHGLKESSNGARAVLIISSIEIRDDTETKAETWGVSHNLILHLTANSITINMKRKRMSIIRNQKIQIAHSFHNKCC